jgi:hypothetical protein
MAILDCFSIRSIGFSVAGRPGDLSAALFGDAAPATKELPETDNQMLSHERGGRQK